MCDAQLREIGLKSLALDVPYVCEVGDGARDLWSSLDAVFVALRYYMRILFLPFRFSSFVFFSFFFFLFFSFFFFFFHSVLFFFFFLFAFLSLNYKGACQVVA